MLLVSSADSVNFIVKSFVYCKLLNHLKNIITKLVMLLVFDKKNQHFYHRSV